MVIKHSYTIIAEIAVGSLLRSENKARLAVLHWTDGGVGVLSLECVVCQVEYSLCLVANADVLMMNFCLGSS